MRIELPEHWTRHDVEELTKLIYPNPMDADQRKYLMPIRSAHHCWRNQPCRFWKVPEGRPEYAGECGIGSGECITEVFNNRHPSRWMPK